MFFQRLAVLIGGFAAGTLVRRRQSHDAALAREWKAQLRAHERRLQRLEGRADAHEAKLKEMPSSAQLDAVMDELLGKAMAGLEVRLTAQARSVETLQITVTQTEELLERVLESLDTLRE